MIMTFPEMKPTNCLKGAKQACKNSYAPYSHFPAGAVLASTGRIFTGTNVENASFGLTICAERVALTQCGGIGEPEHTSHCTLRPETITMRSMQAVHPNLRCIGFFYLSKRSCAKTHQRPVTIRVFVTATLFHFR